MMVAGVVGLVAVGIILAGFLFLLYILAQEFNH